MQSRNGANSARGSACDSAGSADHVECRLSHAGFLGSLRGICDLDMPSEYRGRHALEWRRLHVRSTTKLGSARSLRDLQFSLSENGARNKTKHFLREDNEWKETKLKEIARIASLLNTKICRREL